MEQMFKINEIFEKSDLSVDNIVHSFETNGWICFTKINICAKSYLCRSDVRYPTHKKKY